MKLLIDITCNNPHCLKYKSVQEIFAEDLKDIHCPECLTEATRIFNKTPSFTLSGGGIYKPGTF